MDAVWQTEISEVCKKMYPAWLRSAEYWCRCLRLREEAYDIMARAIECVYANEKPQPADFAGYVFAKMKSIALNGTRVGGRTCYLEFDIPLPEANEYTEPDVSGWNWYREQTARLRGDSFIHPGLYAHRADPVGRVTLSHGSGYVKRACPAIAPRFEVTTWRGGVKQSKKFADKQMAVNEFYKYL